MHPSIGSHQPAQAVHIGAFQLGQLPVFNDEGHNGMAVFQLFQHLNVGGIALLGLFDGLEPQFLKQDMSQLLGGVDVELLPGQTVDLLCQLLDLAAEGGPETEKPSGVQQKALPLHLAQNGNQRQLHFTKEFFHPLFPDALSQGFMEPSHGPCMLG